MEVNCPICSEEFTEDSKAVATDCGHVFHDVCIGHWLENSETCPQCRRQLQGKKLVKLYLNLTSSNDEELDPVMQERRSKENETKMLKKQIRELKTDKLCLIQERVENEAVITRQESRMNILKTKLNNLREKLRNYQLLHQEIINMKKQIQNLDHIGGALKGTQEEVRNLIHNKSSIESVAVVTAALKSVMKSDKNNKVLQMLLKKAQINIQKELSNTLHERDTPTVALNILKTKKGPLNKELNQATRAPTTIIDLTDPPSPSSETVPINSSVVEVENPPSPSFSVGVVAMQRGPPNEAAGSNTIIRSRPASAAAGRANYKRPNMVYDGLGGSRRDDNICTGQRKKAKLDAQAGKPGKK